MESVHNHADSRQLTRVVNEIVRQLNNTGSFTLANSATTTTITNPIVRASSKVIPVPTNAAAAASGWYRVSVSNGSFVIGHSSAVSVRSFDYLVVDV